MRAAFVEKVVSLLAPTQTGHRLVGWGPTDGCATAFPPLPSQMRLSQSSLRGQAVLSTWCPRWTVLG